MYKDVKAVAIQPGACWPLTRYVILLFVFSTVCYGYLRSNFHGFRRFLIHDNYVVLYIQCLRYNICNTWFLDIRISACLTFDPYSIFKPGARLVSYIDLVHEVCVCVCVSVSVCLCVRPRG